MYVSMLMVVHCRSGMSVHVGPSVQQGGGPQDRLQNQEHPLHANQELPRRG